MHSTEIYTFCLWHFSTFYTLAQQGKQNASC